MKRRLTVSVSGVQVCCLFQASATASEVFDQIEIITLDTIVQERIALLMTLPPCISVTHKFRSMLLHFSQSLEITSLRCGFGRDPRALTLLKMFNHFSFGNCELAEGTLLDVFEAVVVVQLE